MMNKWLEKYELMSFSKSSRSPNQTALTALTAQGIEKLIEELNTLNQRWQKACAMDNAGAFCGKSPDYQDRICQELMRINARASEIWDTLEVESPESLKGLYFLEPDGRDDDGPLAA